MRRILSFFVAAALVVSGLVIAAITANADPPPNPNCTLEVPANPLSSVGLATPYELHATEPAAGPCAMSNVANRAFVQASVVDPATKKLSVYNPLVVTQGTTPAAPTVVPVLPPNAVVAVWVGFNGDTLLLHGAGAGDFVNGTAGSPFGQVSFSKSAPAFFTAAQGTTIPANANGKDGLPCQTVRDFALVDQDPSDNVTSTYRLNAAGQTAQNTAANVGVGGVIGNPSDNRLVDVFIDDALGCTPFTAPDLADPGKNVTSQGLNELFAAAVQKQPVGLVPTNDPMTMVNGFLNAEKTNLYRSGVGQPAIKRSVQGEAGFYCENMMAIAPNRLALDAPFTSGHSSPAAGVDLHAFMVDRLNASLMLLGCDGKQPVLTHKKRDDG